MHFIRIRIAAMSIVLAIASSVWAQNASNPIQVALLRWYQANTAVNFSACAGGNTGSVAFDGKHIWVTCYNISEVQELNASDGALVATVTQIWGASGSKYLGLEIGGILFDGANIWVSGNGSSTIGAVAKVNVSAVNGSGSTSMTCASLGAANCTQIQTGLGARGLTFDGTNVWVANSGSNNLTKISPSGATPYSLTNCSQPLALAFSSTPDGKNTYIWVTCSASSPNSVQVLQQTGGSNQYVLSGSGISFPNSLAYDGTNMWVQSNGGINEISGSGPFTVNPSFAMTGNAGGGLVYDGKYMWVGDYSANEVFKLLPAANPANPPTLVLTETVSGAGVGAFDGGNVWVVNSGSTPLLKF